MRQRARVPCSCQAFSACAVLTPGQVHALAAGPRAGAAALGAEPVPAAFCGDSVHGRGCAPCAQDIPLGVREQWFRPALRQRLTRISKKKKKSVSDNVFRTCCKWPLFNVLPRTGILFNCLFCHIFRPKFMSFSGMRCEYTPTINGCVVDIRGQLI